MGLIPIQRAEVSGNFTLGVERGMASTLTRFGMGTWGSSAGRLKRGDFRRAEVVSVE